MKKLRTGGNFGFKTINVPVRLLGIAEYAKKVNGTFLRKNLHGFKAYNIKIATKTDKKYFVLETYLANAQVIF